MDAETYNKTIRRRSANFTKSEVAALMFLIRKYKSQIDPKPPGTSSHRMKEQGWQKITQEFNSLAVTSGCPRNTGILKNKYHNIKKQLRRLRRKNNDEVARPLSNLDPKKITQNLEETLKLVNNTEEEVVQTPDVIEDIIELKQEEISPDNSQDVSQSDETEMKIFTENPETVKPKTVRSKTVHTTEEDIFVLQKQCFLEEHALKLQHMQEKHERSLRLQEEEAEERLRQMKEEHHLQMEILQLRKQCLLK